MLQGAPLNPAHMAQGLDFFWAPQTSGQLRGSVDQSNMTAQAHGWGPWADPYGQDAPSGWELGNNGQFMPTSSPSAGLGSLFFQKPAQQNQQPSQSPQWSNNWLKLASWLTPGEQVPGGPASQWWTGWLKGGW